MIEHGHSVAPRAGVEVLFARLENAPDDQAVARDSGAVLKWRDLRRRVGAWQQVLNAASGDRFAVYLDDAFEYLAVIYALGRSGACAVLAGDTASTTCDALAVDVNGFIGDFPDVCTPVPRPVDAEFDRRRSAANPDLALIEVFTSGSTGRPQRIAKTTCQLDAEIEALEAIWGASIGTGEVLGTVPHQHLFGVTFRLLWPIAAARPFRVEQAIYPEWLCQTALAPGTLIISSPAFLSRVFDYQGWSRVAPRIALVISSGGALAFEHAARASGLMEVSVCEIYGSSETGAIGWRERGRDRIPWQPLPGTRIATDGSGQFRAAHMPDTRAWYPLPDRVAVSADGSFELLGRTDRIAKIEDRRVSLAAVEAAVQSADGVVDCRVVVIEARKTILGAVVVLAGKVDDRERLARRLHRHAAERLESVAVPRRWRFVDEIPVNAMGKVVHARLLELFERD